MQVDLGILIAPDAALAIVAPSQQLSGGAARSQERRAALLCWAEDENKWIIEDDNLSELQLDGRAPPAMAADDPSGRVIYVGTRSEEHTSELQSLMRISYAVFCLKKKTKE